MKKETHSPITPNLESIKLNNIVVGMVRLNKQKTGVPIGKFFEQAAIEKLEKQKLKK